MVQVRGLSTRVLGLGTGTYFSTYSACLEPLWHNVLSWLQPVNAVIVHRIVTLTSHKSRKLKTPKQQQFVLYKMQYWCLQVRRMPGPRTRTFLSCVWQTKQDGAKGLDPKWVLPFSLWRLLRGSSGHKHDIQKSFCPGFPPLLAVTPVSHCLHLGLIFFLSLCQSKLCLISSVVVFLNVLCVEIGPFLS